MAREEALRRYRESEPRDLDPTVEEMDVDDEFLVYEIWNEE